MGKKPTGDNTICRLYQCLWFHSQRGEGTNSTSIQHTKRDRSSNNGSLWKHQSESTFTGWRHRLLRHCSRSTARRLASPIPLYHLSRLSIDKIKENGFELTKKRSKNNYRRSLKLVDKFTYLRSGVSSAEKDIDKRLTKAWTAIDKLSVIWKSDLTDKMKRSFFQAAVVSILLYGCTTWTLTKRMEKKLDGNYKRMLRAILNKSWRKHPTKPQLYGHLSPIMKTIKVRRNTHAEHCRRCKWCSPMDPVIWPNKSRTTSSNLHTAAMWGYGM